MFSRKFVKWYLHINQSCAMVQAFIYSLFFGFFYDFSDIFNVFILNKHEYEVCKFVLLHDVSVNHRYISRLSNKTKFGGLG